MPTPSQRATSVTPALPKRPASQELDIVQQIEHIRTRCQRPTAGEQLSILFSVLAPLFDAVCTRLTHDKYATISIHKKLNAIETLIKKLIKKRYRNSFSPQTTLTLQQANANRKFY
jgi:hypothetical protein